MQQRAFTEAHYDMKKVIELRPNYWKAWYNIGSIDTELGNFKTAIEAFKNALQNAPAKNRPAIQKKIKILETKQVPRNR
jgi:tetratricopeptide (TPR) repeat protein